MKIRHTLTCVIAAATLALAGCGDAASRDQFADRIDSIDAVYRQGVKARAAILRNDLGVLTDESCGKAFIDTGASPDIEDRSDDEAFQALRRRAFVNGCMNRPNDVSPSSTPTSSPSPTAKESAA